MAKQYYDITNLWNTEATYLMPIGQRANGKSYQARDKMLEQYKKFNERFIYLRRWKDDIKPYEVEKWFNMKQLKKYFPSAHGVKCLQNKIYTTKLNEKGMEVKDEFIGWYLALNEAERYKSWEEISESNARNVVFEEFITNKVYIDDEPNQLMQLVSTCVRHAKARVILIGNTISQVCPYFEEWELVNCLDQEQGTIDIYHQKTLDGKVIDIALENCNSIQYENHMFFGNTAKQIINGEWESQEYPKRPKGDWETEYEISVKFGLHSYIMQIQSNEKDEMIVFVYKSERKCDRTITNAFSTDWETTKTLLLEYSAEQLISKLWRRNKFCYSTNLVGTSFNQLQDTYHFIL